MLGVYLPLKIFDRVCKILNDTHFCFVFLNTGLCMDWLWGEENEENHRAMSEMVVATSIWVFHLLEA